MSVVLQNNGSYPMQSFRLSEITEYESYLLTKSVRIVCGAASEAATAKMEALRCVHGPPSCALRVAVREAVLGAASAQMSLPL